jgi:rSAM/selenodomain-associated transferase 1
METCGLLLVKNPQPGKVKTRLHSHCSAQQATELYRAFILDSAAILAASGADLKAIAYAPANAEGAMRQLLATAGGFTFTPQPEGDLGQRLEALMQWSFAQGAKRTAIIGSDSPSLPPSYLDQALELLGEKEVVLGPSVDGGYYLVGQQAGQSAIFQDVTWSTGAVLWQTLERLGGQSLGLLPPWYDVDTPSAAGFLKVHLEALRRAGCARGQHSLEVLRRMELPLPS